MVDNQEVNLLNAKKLAPEQEPGFEVTMETGDMGQEAGGVDSRGEVTSPEISSVSDKESEIPSVAAVAAASAPPVVIAKDPILVDIENLLSEDLTDMYLSLPDEKKIAFRKKGEEVAVKIQEMVHTGKIKAIKILEMIRDWLQMIPGVNKFFLEQEVKIKADKMIKYANEQTKSSVNKL